MTPTPFIIPRQIGFQIKVKVVGERAPMRRGAPREAGIERANHLASIIGVGVTPKRSPIFGEELDKAPANGVKAEGLPIHIRTPCVAQEKGLGKLDRTRRSSTAPRRGYRLPRTAYVVAAAAALTACAHQPLTRSCLTQKQYEQLKAAEPPRIHDKLTGKADEDTRPLAGSALELRSWGHAMLDTLKICSTP